MRQLAFASYLALAVLAVGSDVIRHDVAAAQPVTLAHIHGLAFTPDGKRLLIPSHQGLAVYNAGEWSKAPGPEHDYMGFTATKSYLYSSGHPAPASSLVNPFGLIRSSDGGRSWDKLGMEGESDFHVLAAGYETNAVYVYNHEPNSRMERPGLYSTVNQGFTWRRAEAKGLAGDILCLAAHPTLRDTLAAGTKTGLYLSRDGGKSFQALVQGSQVLSVLFDLDGEHLWYGAYDVRATLIRIGLRRAGREAVRLPPMQEDAPAYIAQNPADRLQLAIATFRRNVYLSGDQGKAWRQIAREGVGL